MLTPPNSVFDHFVRLALKGLNIQNYGRARSAYTSLTMRRSYRWGSYYYFSQGCESFPSEIDVSGVKF